MPLVRGKAQRQRSTVLVALEIHRLSTITPKLESKTMSDFLSDLSNVLDTWATFFDSVPYVWQVVALSIICACCADDIKERYLLHFWVRAIYSKMNN